MTDTVIIVNVNGRFYHFYPESTPVEAGTFLRADEDAHVTLLVADCAGAIKAHAYLTGEWMRKVGRE